MGRTGQYGHSVSKDTRNSKCYLVRVKNPITKVNKSYGSFDNLEDAQRCADKQLMVRFVKYGIDAPINNEEVRQSLIMESIKEVDAQFEKDTESGMRMMNVYHYNVSPEMEHLRPFVDQSKVEVVLPDEDVLDMVLDDHDVDELLQDLSN